MPTVKGILSFPQLFTPKIAKGANEPKFSVGILLPPTDPQLSGLLQEIEQAKLNTFPNGYTGTDQCLDEYNTRVAGKDYYDPRFSGWYLLTCNAKADDRPAVVNMNRQPVIDPSSVYSGMIGYVSLSIGGYTKGKGGIGGWLNGVMITNEAPPMGRLDGKPTIEQMFANVGNISTAAPAAPIAPIAPIAPAAPIAPVELIMTAAANGLTYEQYKESGWTDEQMITAGIAQKPIFA